MVTSDGFERLPENKLAPLLKAVATQGPVAVSVDAGEWSMYQNGIFDSCKQDATINHAVLLVGYGTDKKLGKDYFLIRNSWGPDWGENGFIRLQRHSSDEGSAGYCGTDSNPLEGVGCKGGPAKIPVCGMCGVLSDSAYPKGVRVTSSHDEGTHTQEGPTATASPVVMGNGADAEQVDKDAAQLQDEDEDVGETEFEDEEAIQKELHQMDALEDTEEDTALEEEDFNDEEEDEEEGQDAREVQVADGSISSVEEEEARQEEPDERDAEESFSEDGEEVDEEEPEEQDAEESSFIGDDVDDEEDIDDEDHNEQDNGEPAFVQEDVEDEGENVEGKRCRRLNESCRSKSDCCNRRYCAGRGSVRWCSNVDNDGRP